MFINKKIILMIMVTISCLFVYQPKAKAMDPVTIAILAPYAIEAAQTLAPYVQRGLASGAAGTMTLIADTFEILYLPLGVVQTTVGAPFGAMGAGMNNIGKGCVAPFKVAYDAVVLPIKFLGVL